MGHHPNIWETTPKHRAHVYIGFHVLESAPFVGETSGQWQPKDNLRCRSTCSRPRRTHHGTATGRLIRPSMRFPQPSCPQKTSRSRELRSLGRSPYRDEHLVLLVTQRPGIWTRRSRIRRGVQKIWSGQVISQVCVELNSDRVLPLASYCLGVHILMRALLILNTEKCRRRTS